MPITLPFRGAHYNVVHTLAVAYNALLRPYTLYEMSSFTHTNAVKVCN